MQLQMLVGHVAAFFGTGSLIDHASAIEATRTHIVHALRYRNLPDAHNEGEKAKREIAKALISSVNKGKVEEYKYRYAVQTRLFKLSFADSGTLNLLPWMSDPNEASLDLRRIFYWNCGQLVQNYPLDTVIKALESCFINKRIDSLNSELSQVGAERLGVQATLCTTTLSRSAAGLGYESHDCQNLISPFADYSKIILAQLARHGHYYFKCKLSNNRIILMVAIVCEQKQVALIVIDPLNAEITPDSEAWAYIQFLKRYIMIGSPADPHNAPLGLVNLGTTCYANSTLQCLLALPNFVEYVRNHELFKQATACQYFQELIRLCYSARIAGVEALKPLRLASIVNLIKLNDDEQCPGEFIDKLFGRMVFHPLDCDVHSQEQADGLYAHFKVKWKETYNHRDAGFLNENETFHGHLPLIMDGQEKTLDDCLAYHFAREEMGAYRAYRDGVTKSTSISETQEYIIFSLRRTGFQLGQPVKYTNCITFPLEHLDLSPYMSAPVSTRYRLKGVIMHKGSPTGGHYTALVLDGSHWYLCNDGQVSMQDEFVRSIAAGAQWETFTPVTFFYEREAAGASAVGPSAASAAAPSAAY